MRFALTDLIRMIAVSGLATFTLAVAVGHWREEASSFDVATAACTPAIPYAFVGSPGTHQARFLDSRTGGLVDLDLPPGDRIEYASCAPWQDPRGRRLVAGRWSRRSHDGENATGIDFGLAYFRMPDGSCLKRIATELWPVSTPCWYPDGPDRILFAAGDGRLYQHRLGGPDEADDLDANPLTPIAFDESLGWEEPPYLNEPHWPAPLTDRRVIFVTLSLRSPGAIRFDTPAIWWLRLDEAGDRVIEAGRLTTAVYDVDGVAAEEYRSACFDGPDGSPRLLYESRQDGQSPWQLRVAEVSTDPSTARPSAGPSRRISEDVLSGVHLLSPDGLSVYSIFHPWGFDPRVRKVPFAMPATLTVR